MGVSIYWLTGEQNANPHIPREQEESLIEHFLISLFGEEG
jgi:hypothetical protein